ncbi:hypothetical protein V1498_21885 [Peribacillus sp. SCS-26]
MNRAMPLFLEGIAQSPEIMPRGSMSSRIHALVKRKAQLLIDSQING